MTQQQKAIILGGSITGLLAARVLSAYVEQVIVIERDELSDEPMHRKGAPQAHHLHALLERGVDIIEELFPGIFTGLEQDGGVPVNMGQELGLYLHGNWGIPFDATSKGYSMSRLLLEYHLRKQVKAISNVTILGGCAVEGFLTNDNKTEIVGVCCRQRSTQQAQIQEVYGDLVVDATGRGSRTPQQLEALGLPRVEETELVVNICYATARYQIPPIYKPSRLFTGIVSEAPEKSMGFMAQTENGQYIVTLVGKLGTEPPTAPDAFVEYARQLPQPDIYNAIKNTQPLGEITTFRTPSNLRRHYERMATLPEGLIVMGQAACSFNPVFGQGMTTSALEAMALNKVLHRHGGLQRDLSHKFQKAIAKAEDTAWVMATSEDMRHPEIGVDVPVITRVMNWYLKQMHDTAAYDKYAHEVFSAVQNMVSSPLRIFEPAMLYRVLRHVLRSPAN